MVRSDVERKQSGGVYPMDSSALVQCVGLTESVVVPRDRRPSPSDTDVRGRCVLEILSYAAGPVCVGRHLLLCGILSDSAKDGCRGSFCAAMTSSQ